MFTQVVEICHCSALLRLLCFNLLYVRLYLLNYPLKLFCFNSCFGAAQASLQINHGFIIILAFLLTFSHFVEKLA